MALETLDKEIDISNLEIEQERAFITNPFESLTDDDKQHLVDEIKKESTRNISTFIFMKSKLKDLLPDSEITKLIPFEQVMIKELCRSYLGIKNVVSAYEVAGHWAKVDSQITLSNEDLHTLSQYGTDALKRALQARDMHKYLIFANHWYYLFPGQPLPFVPLEREWEVFYSGLDFKGPASLKSLAEIKIIFPDHYQKYINFRTQWQELIEMLKQYRGKRAWRDWLALASPLYIVSKSEHIASDSDQEIPIYRKF